MSGGSGDELLSKSNMVMVEAGGHQIQDEPETHRLSTEFIIKGSKISATIGVEDDVTTVSKEFIAYHGLSDNLLQTIEKELYFTQVELCRRVITDYDEEIDELASKCEELQMTSRKERDAVLQLKGIVSEKDVQISDLQALLEDASRRLKQLVQPGTPVIPMRTITDVVREVEKTFDRKDREIAEAQAENQTLQEKQAQQIEQGMVLKDSIDALQNGVREAKRKCEKQMLDSAEAHRAILQEKDEHASRLQERCIQLQEELTHKIEALQSAEADARNAYESMEASSNESHELRARIAQTEEQRAQTEEQLEERLQELTVENAKLQNRCLDGDQHNSKLKIKLSEATTELKKLQQAIGGALATASAAGQRVNLLEGCLKGSLMEEGLVAPTLTGLGGGLSGKLSTSALAAPSPPPTPSGPFRVAAATVHHSTPAPARGAGPTRHNGDSSSAPASLSVDVQMNLLRQCFEQHATAEHYNGQHQMSLTKFRKFVYDAGAVDRRKIVPGDIDVVYHKVVKSGATTSGARSGENFMTIEQFYEAMRLLSSKLYVDMIERMAGKRLSFLTFEEREVALDAALEVFITQFIKPYVENNIRASLPGFDMMVAQHTVELSQPQIIRHVEVELRSLAQVYTYYSESLRAKSKPTAQRNDYMSFKELTRMLTDYRVIPKLAESSHVFALWRAISNRDSDGEYHGIQFTLTNTVSPKSNGVSVNMLLSMKPREDYISFAQFVEILGHIAFESMPHMSMKARLSALFTWLDQSDGNVLLAKERSTAVVRFASARPV